MGHIITPAGQRADDAKIKAIIDMPPPVDKQSLQRLLGMTKFLAQYVPNEASLTAPLTQTAAQERCSMAVVSTPQYSARFPENCSHTGTSVEVLRPQEATNKNYKLTHQKMN